MSYEEEDDFEYLGPTDDDDQYDNEEDDDEDLLDRINKLNEG